MVFRVKGLESLIVLDPYPWLPFCPEDNQASSSLFSPGAKTRDNKTPPKMSTAQLSVGK